MPSWVSLIMIKERHPRVPRKSVFLIGILFVFLSVIVARLIPRARFEPDMALILTIYCALYLQERGGVILPLFAGAYVGSFTAFPIEYMVLYPLLYFSIRFVTSFFQLRFVGYPMFLAFILEYIVGGVYALGIYLNQPELFSMGVVSRIIMTQALITSLFLPLIFFVFERFSQKPSLPLRLTLK